MSQNRPALFRIHTPTTRRFQLQGLLAALLLSSAPLAFAQNQPPSDTEAGQGVRDSRLSDSDRMFMRGVAPLIIRNRQLGELGRKRLPQGESRRFAVALSEQSNRTFETLKALAEELRNPIPMDMSDVAHARLRQLSEQRGASFQRAYKALAKEWLQEERDSHDDALSRSENERVRSWAGEVQKARGALLERADKLAEPGR